MAIISLEGSKHLCHIIHSICHSAHLTYTAIIDTLRSVMLQQMYICAASQMYHIVNWIFFQRFSMHIWYISHDFGLYVHSYMCVCVVIGAVTMKVLKLHHREHGVCMLYTKLDTSFGSVCVFVIIVFKSDNKVKKNINQLDWPNVSGYLLLPCTHIITHINGWKHR